MKKFFWQLNFWNRKNGVSSSIKLQIAAPLVQKSAECPMRAGFFVQHGMGIL